VSREPGCEGRLSERIRILYVVQGIIPNTGPGRHLFKLMAYRNKATVDVEVFAFDVCDPAMMNELARDHGVRATVLGGSFTSPRTYLRGWPALRRRIREFRPHVIQTHHTPIVDWVARVAGRWAGVPLNLSRAVSQPRTYHLSRRGRLAWWFTRLGDTVTRPLVDYYLPNSADVATYLADVEGVPPRKIVTIGNGIDTDLFQPSAELRQAGRQQLGLAADDLLIVTVGILKEHKGQRYLVEAAARLMSRLSGLRVALVGAPMSAEDEVYAAELRERVSVLGMAEHFMFLGMRADVRPVLAAADIYAHPSLHEGSSNAVLEAMAMGCACVVSDVTGCPELVDQGRAGLVVLQRDIPALTAALDSLLGDGFRRQALGAEARQRAEQVYGVRRMCAECEAVARRGLREKGVDPSNGEGMAPRDGAARARR